MSVTGAGQTIQSELSQWTGIEAAPHRFGGLEYRLGTREIGHVHGDSLVDVPLPKKVRDELVTSGQANRHHVLPESGWVSVYLNEPGDVERAIGILRRSFDAAMQQRERRAGSPVRE